MTKHLGTPDLKLFSLKQTPGLYYHLDAVENLIHFAPKTARFGTRAAAPEQLFGVAVGLMGVRDFNRRLTAYAGSNERAVVCYTKDSGEWVIGLAPAKARLGSFQVAGDRLRHPAVAVPLGREATKVFMGFYNLAMDTFVAVPIAGLSVDGILKATRREQGPTGLVDSAGLAGMTRAELSDIALNSQSEIPVVAVHS